MSRQEQKNAEEILTGDEEYDEYLFWPSLSRRYASGDSPSSPLYGPVSLQSESTDYDFSSGRISPITFAASIDSRPEPDFSVAPSKSRAEAEPPKEQKKKEPVKYSSTFKLGLYLSQMVNRAIDGVKIKIRKPRRSQAP